MIPERNILRRPGAFLVWGLLASMGACAPGRMEPFPPTFMPGVDVHQADYRLQDAVAEYIGFRNLPVSPEGMRRGVTLTEWFPVEQIERPPTPLAECPDAGSPRREGEPEYRARYRFSVLPRGGIRLFRVEAHWQKWEPTAAGDSLHWVDCRSTGNWERVTQDRILLRAELLSQRYRESG